MPALRFRLTPRRRRLAAAALLAGAALAWDVSRAPAEQVTARAYLAAVAGYQAHLRPAVSRVCTCRMQPSCSEYSAECVRRLGLVRGLSATILRLARCSGSPPGTSDPPPAR